MKNYYLEVSCLNCRKKKTEGIPLGISAFEFRTKTKCENCGCFMSGHSEKDPQNHLKKDER